jgi:glycosyltransferase involved in cell wall biosynthesis
MASALTGVSDDYTDKFRKYTDGKPVRSFHLGHSVSDFKSEIDPDWSFLAKQSGEPWVTYVGTVSRNYDLVTVMGAARELPGVKFLIVGKGEGFSEITRLVREGMLGNVVLTGEVPYHDLVNLLHRSDVGLVTVNNDAFIRFPYKANDYLVAGLPILTNIRGGEMERVLLEARIGEVYQEMDVSDFVLKLKRLLASSDVEMRERVSRYASEHCDSDRVYQSYLDWVSEIAKAQKHRP